VASLVLGGGDNADVVIKLSCFIASDAPTDSLWFNVIMPGTKACVGKRLKQDAAIPVTMMLMKQA
jgi:hypothetical protein